MHDSNEFDVLMFTSAQQVVHVLQIAEEENAKDEWMPGRFKNDDCLSRSRLLRSIATGRAFSRF